VIVRSISSADAAGPASRDTHYRFFPFLPPSGQIYYWRNLQSCPETTGQRNYSHSASQSLRNERSRDTVRFDSFRPRCWSISLWLVTPRSDVDATRGRQAPNVENVSYLAPSGRSGSGANLFRGIV